MAKVTEGDPYYYAPSIDAHEKPNNYCIFSKKNHPALECLAIDVSQDNASLIVDALNFLYDATETTLDSEFYRIQLAIKPHAAVITEQLRDAKT